MAWQDYLDENQAVIRTLKDGATQVVPKTDINGIILNEKGETYQQLVSERYKYITGITNVTIAENLQTINTSRTDIISAINTKGGSLSLNAGFTDIKTAIDGLVSEKTPVETQTNFTEAAQTALQTAIDSIRNAISAKGVDAHDTMVQNLAEKISSI